MNRLVVALAVGGLTLPALCAPRAARAAGFEIPDNGTVALGRGGAFVAVATDGTAIDYNPAGLTQQDGLQLTLDANFITHSVSFLRTDDQGTNGLVDIQSVKNSEKNFLSPIAAISYTHKFTVAALSVAAGVYGPPAEGKYAFPAPGDDPASDSPNRYQLIKNNIFILYPTISVAYRLPISRVYAAIGVSGQMVISHFQFNQDLYAQPTLTSILGFPKDDQGHSPGLGDTYRGPGVSSSTMCPKTYDPNCHATAALGSAASSPTKLHLEDPIWDANVNVDVTGKKAFTAVLGALVKAGPVSVGASFRPGYTLNAEGPLTVTLPGILTAPGVDDSPNGPSTTFGAEAHVPDGSRTKLKLNWPSLFRAGVDVDIKPVPGKFDVAGEFTYETWSVVDQFLLTPENVNITAQAGGNPITLPVNPVSIPKHMQDSQSYRLGAQWQLPITKVLVQTRLGGYYEKSAIPEPYTTIDLAHFSRFAATAGASVGINGGNFFGPLTLDLAALYSPPVTREVRDSQIMLTASDPYLATDAVGNGNYTSSIFIFSVGLRAHLDI